MSDLSTDSMHCLVIETCQHGETCVIAVRGDLDISTRRSVRAAFGRASMSGDHAVVDASEVTFLDCGGLRSLLSAATNFPGDVWLRAPSDPVRRIAELAGLWDEWSAGASGGDLRIR